MKPSEASPNPSTVDFADPAAASQPLRSSSAKPSTFDPRHSTQPSALPPIQTELSEIFADLAELFGNPSSIGSIYGLLFASPQPLSMEEIVERLGISTGTASQGLRRLVELEAVMPQKGDGERFTRYSAKLELRPFVAMFLEQQLMPRLARSAERLGALEAMIPGLPDSERETLTFRLGRATKWHQRAKTFLPLIRRFLKG